MRAAEKLTSSTPNLEQFDPRDVPWQYQPVLDIRENFDYSLGAHELLFSGSVGSAKSILAAHLGITHCLMYPGARLCLGRKSLKDLKRTIFQKIKEHLRGSLIEGVHYKIDKTSAGIQLANGSEIISTSWRDKEYEKVRSYELSAVIIEELTENDDDDKRAYDELTQRVERLPHVPENWIISCTNPDSPEHWVYKYFILDQDNPTKHVYYSLTEQNKFLKPSYIERLKRNLDPKMAQRMLYGQWVEIAKEVVYYQYSREKHFKNSDYQINPHHPIRVSFDFNIGEGKPLSAVFFQYIGDHFHFFDQVVVEGARTEDVLEEAAGRGLLDHRAHYIVHGDATGRNRDTRSPKSDYDIISKFLANYRTQRGSRIHYSVDVPSRNPGLRARHNLVNAYLENCNGQNRVTVYGKCETLDEGFRLTKLKKGGKYIEDDSKPYQHITTAAGYGMWACVHESAGPVVEMI